MSGSSSESREGGLFINAVTLGPEVFALRRPPKPGGRIIALLKDAIYIESHEGYVVAIVRGNGADGPLSMRVPSFDRLHASPHVFEGAEVAISIFVMTIGGSARISWRNAEPWQPALPDRPGPPVQRMAANTALRRSLDEGKEEGGPARRGSARIEEAVRAYREAISATDYARGAQALERLLGVGEGLTPEGDDVAMALLASAVWWAASAMLDPVGVRFMVNRVRAVAASATNKISARLLWHAGEGILLAPAMALGEAIMVGSPLQVRPHLNTLLVVGHSTGRALARGLAEGLRELQPPAETTDDP